MRAGGGRRSVALHEGDIRITYEVDEEASAVYIAHVGVVT